jgi:hypothetical protein
MLAIIIGIQKKYAFAIQANDKHHGTKGKRLRKGHEMSTKDERTPVIDNLAVVFSSTRSITNKHVSYKLFFK